MTRLQFPVTPPVGLLPGLLAEVCAINSRLLAWGYCENYRDHASHLKSQVKKYRCRAHWPDAWVKDTEKWMREGDNIVVGLERLVGPAAAALPHRSVIQLWQAISSVAFTAMGMIATTQVKLEEVEASCSK